MRNPDPSSIALLAHLLRDNPSNQTCHAAAEMLERLIPSGADTLLARQVSGLNAQLELEKIAHRRTLEASRAKRKYQLIFSIATGIVLGVVSSMAIPSAHSEPSIGHHSPRKTPESLHPGLKGSHHGNQQIHRLI